MSRTLKPFTPDETQRLRELCANYKTREAMKAADRSTFMRLQLRGLLDEFFPTASLNPGLDESAPPGVVYILRLPFTRGAATAYKIGVTTRDKVARLLRVYMGRLRGQRTDFAPYGFEVTHQTDNPDELRSRVLKATPNGAPTDTESMQLYTLLDDWISGYRSVRFMTPIELDETKLSLSAHDENIRREIASRPAYDPTRFFYDPTTGRV